MSDEVFDPGTTPEGGEPGGDPGEPGTAPFAPPGRRDPAAEGPGHPGTAPAAPPAPLGPGGAPEGGEVRGRNRSLWSDAWRDLRRNPVFLVSAALIVFFVLLAVRPTLLTGADPLDCDIALSQEGPRGGHPFGFDTQGATCSPAPSTAHGPPSRSASAPPRAPPSSAASSAACGVLRRLVGRRPQPGRGRLLRPALLLGGLVFLSVVPSGSVWPVVAFIVLLGLAADRPHHPRLRPHRQGGRLRPGRACPGRLPGPHPAPPHRAQRRRPRHRRRHHRAGHLHLPGGDALLPRRRTQPPTVSWGIDISDASRQIRNAPHMLLWPAGALSLTVLAFIMLGDAVRDALDPKLR